MKVNCDPEEAAMTDDILTSEDKALRFSALRDGENHDRALVAIIDRLAAEVSRLTKERDEARANAVVSLHYEEPVEAMGWYNKWKEQNGYVEFLRERLVKECSRGWHEALDAVDGVWGGTVGEWVALRTRYPREDT